jgi:hypothetical protein
MAAAYDISSGRRMLNANELIELSLRRTAEIRKSGTGHE